MSRIRFVAAAVVVWAGVVWAQEKTVTFDRLPAGVQAAIREKAAGGSVGEITESAGAGGDGRTYTVIIADKDGNETLHTFKSNAVATTGPATEAGVGPVRVEVSVPPVASGDAANAAVPEEDDEGKVAFGALPAVVQATFTKECDGAALPKKVGKDGEGEDTTYDVEIVIRKKTYEVSVRQDGTLLSKVLTDEPVKAVGGGPVDGVKGK